MTLQFLPEARDEFVAAALWYETQEPGMGVRFRDEIHHVTARIASDPYLWREREDGWRRVNRPVFPYYTAYFIRNDTVVVAAVAHGHRRPNYWRGRL